MSIINDFQNTPPEFNLADLLESIEQSVPAQMGQKSPAAIRHVQGMYVAGGIVYEHFGRRPPKEIPLSELINLDCHSVARRVARDADPETIGGVARCVNNLVQHARSMQPLAQGGFSGAWSKILGIARRLFRGTFGARSKARRRNSAA
jgi:hypothetical protein